MALQQRQQRIDTNAYLIREKDLQTILSNGQTTIDLTKNTRSMNGKVFFAHAGLTEAKSQAFTHTDWGECYVWTGADFGKLQSKEAFPINEIEIISQDFAEIVDSFNSALEEKEIELSEKDAKIAELERKIAAMNTPKKRGGTPTSLLDTPTTEQ